MDQPDKISQQWPPKVRQGFPLTIGAKGYYARFAGKFRWVCSRKIAPDQAEAIYHRKAAALASGLGGIIEQVKLDGVITLRYILNAWLAQRDRDFKAGKLSSSAYIQYVRSAKRINNIAGHIATDAISPDIVRSIYDRIRKDFSEDAARRAIAHLRQACRTGEDMDWCKPIRLGRQVSRLAATPPPSMKWKLFAPDQIRAIIAEVERKIAGADGRALPSWIQFRAMLWLALNGGYGASELAQMPRAVIELDHARIDHNRGKTGASHIVPLWNETIVAITAVMKQRPGDELLFRTRQGNPWVIGNITEKKGKIGRSSTDRVNERFRELIGPMSLRIKGQGFYKLKHLHCTIADRAGDPHATFALAGHKLPGSKSHYVQIDEDRLRRVVDHIHHVLFTLDPKCRSEKPRSSVRRVKRRKRESA